MKYSTNINGYISIELLDGLRFNDGLSNFYWKDYSYLDFSNNEKRILTDLTNDLKFKEKLVKGKSFQYKGIRWTKL